MKAQLYGVYRGYLTSSKSALVNPGVHVCAFVLELLDLQCGIFELVTELFDPIMVGFDGFVDGFIEGFGQWIRGGGQIHVCGRCVGCRITRCARRSLR